VPFIREHGGEPSSRQIDELLDERLAHRGRAGATRRRSRHSAGLRGVAVDLPASGRRLHPGNRQELVHLDRATLHEVRVSLEHRLQCFGGLSLQN
jgi:hypothetical protein